MPTLSSSDNLPQQHASRQRSPPPSPEEKRRQEKHLVQSPSPYFMDATCPAGYAIATLFSQAQTVVLCVGGSTVLFQPTGGTARLTEGCSFRRKQH
ncbi:40S ribosomal protein S27-like [Myotis myotis]|uniref:40S ribosomal protein S27-like n=1 Tax=Myotis myotis TaxID=51298 RepID=UPI00174C8AD9|nr:40S ribosomal protein S27-like [Myotis myotis]